MVTRKEREIEFKENLIVDAAEQLFTDKGFEETTMDDIAKQAEYTKPTLYKYFKSKEEIFLSVYLRGWYNSVELIFQAMKKEELGFGKLKAASIAYNEYFKEHPIYFSLLKYIHSKGIKLCGKDCTREKEHKEASKGMVKDFKKIITAGKKDGSITKEIEPEIAVSYFLNNLYINMYTFHNKEDVAVNFLNRATKLMLKVFK